MRQQVQVQLKELLGAEEYNRLVEEVIVPRIEREAKEGHIRPFELARLAYYVEKNGPGVLDVWAEDSGCATKHGVKDGGVILARTNLPGSGGISLCIKEFSDRKSFERASLIERKITAHLQKAGIRGAVPEQLYQNPSKRIMIMPNVGAALSNVLKQEVESARLGVWDEIREDLLREVIWKYCRITEQVNSAGLFKPKPKSRFARAFSQESLDALVDSSEFFSARFGPSPALAEMYEREIGSRLRDYEKEFIHGDLHPGNILIGSYGSAKSGSADSPSAVFIDWESAGFGFMEFDLGKLLTKFNVHFDEELKWVDYAVGVKENLRAKRIEESALAVPSERKSKSQERYVLNAIAQDLLTAKRYLDRAGEKESERLETVAVVAYNIALQRMEWAEGKGFVSADLRKEVERDMKERGLPLSRLTDEQFAVLSLHHHPHKALSQENLVSPSFDGPAERVDAELYEVHMGKIRKGLRKRDWRMIARRAVAAGVLAGAALFGAGQWYAKRQDENIARLKYSQSLVDSGYRHDFDAAYADLVTARLHLDPVGDVLNRRGPRGLEVHDVDWPGKNMPPRPVWFDRPDANVVAAGQVNNIPANLIRTILHANTIGAQPGRSLVLCEQGLNLFDPYRTGYLRNTQIGELRDPKTNLEYGCARLSQLLNKYQVDRRALHEYYPSNEELRYFGRERNWREAPAGLVEALQEFYTADKLDEERMDYAMRHRLPYEPRYEERERERRERGLKVPRLARTLIYTVIMGGPTTYDFGINSLWITLPEDFLAD